ncbi:MAG: response regulator [Verrucomicrobia subdivision 3 bacterium]|nr:response regulator [Limisphaerales bacterium]
MIEGKPVILVAEDNENDVVLLQRAFGAAGIVSSRHYVSDGQEAVEFLRGDGRFADRAAFPMPDLLLLDLKMPRMNGFEVIQWVRAQSFLEHLRIVVLTTSSDIADIERAYQLGAHSFLTKPANLDDFKNMIASVYRYWKAFGLTPKS